MTKFRDFGLLRATSLSQSTVKLQARCSMAGIRSFLGLSAVCMVACLFPTLAASASGTSTPNVTGCQLSAADQAWIDQALEARRLMSRQIRGARLNSEANLIIFDDDCAITGTSAFSDLPVAWTSARHGGTVALPGGREQPADVTSFAGESAGQAFFVMSAPSVWQAKRVPGGPMGLEKLMTGVFLHESAHVAQYATYMRQVGQIAERENLPESFGDDSIQERFRDNLDFAASVAQETELLYAAAVASQDAEALRLARKARALIEARRSRWFTGKETYLGKLEDLFLTLEGSGQWVAYRWLIDGRGGGMTREAAIKNFGRRGGWWTQDEGLALVLATERLGGTGWRACAFGTGALAGVELLDRALKGSRSARVKAVDRSCESSTS